MHCRICLTDVTPLVGIFSDDGLKHQISDKISTCLQIQIHKDDCLPDKVCYKCFMCLNEFFSFWKKARESYSLLHKLQNDVNMKQSVSWPSIKTESEVMAKEPTPDILDMIDMETTTKRQLTDFWKQRGDSDYTSKITDANKHLREFSPNLSCDDATRRFTPSCNAINRQTATESTLEVKQWEHLNKESSAQQLYTTNKDNLDSKANQFISKQFSFGRPSMNYDLPKGTQGNHTNSWEALHGSKLQPNLHIAERERGTFNDMFCFPRKCSSSGETNPSFEHKAPNPISQPIFSSNDEYSLPNIPLSLFSISDDKKEMPLQTKKSMEIKHSENLQPQALNIESDKKINCQQTVNDIEMTPRSKVMKMLHREIW